MSNPLYYKIKDNVALNKHHLIDLFFRDWVDDICDNGVNFRTERTNVSDLSDTFVVDFESQEDAIAVRLRGVPKKFQMYLEIIN